MSTVTNRYWSLHLPVASGSARDRRRHRRALLHRIKNGSIIMHLRPDEIAAYLKGQGTMTDFFALNAHREAHP